MICYMLMPIPALKLCQFGKNGNNFQAKTNICFKALDRNSQIKDYFEESKESSGMHI